MMCVGTEFALVVLQTITNPSRRAEVVQKLEENGRTVIDMSFDQMSEFAANALELQGKDGLVLALSNRALRALRPDQVEVMERSAKLLPLNVPTIELAGGLVRCMLRRYSSDPSPFICSTGCSRDAFRFGNAF